MNDVTHRISVEGADPLVLAAVHDQHLVALARATETRVALRGDQLVLAGALENVERASRLAVAMVDRARRGELEADDLQRLLTDGPDPDDGANGDTRITLPGVRKIVQPKTPGQRDYIQAIREQALARDAERGYVPVFWRAVVAHGLGQTATTLDLLEQAFAERYPQVPYLAVEPGFDPLWTHPRFLHLTERIGIGHVIAGGPAQGGHP